MSTRTRRVHSRSNPRYVLPCPLYLTSPYQATLSIHLCRIHSTHPNTFSPVKHIVSTRHGMSSFRELWSLKGYAFHHQDHWWVVLPVSLDKSPKPIQLVSKGHYNLCECWSECVKLWSTPWIRPRDDLLPMPVKVVHQAWSSQTQQRFDCHSVQKRKAKKNRMKFHSNFQHDRQNIRLIAASHPGEVDGGSATAYEAPTGFRSKTTTRVHQFSTHPLNEALSFSPISMPQISGIIPKSGSGRGCPTAF